MELEDFFDAYALIKAEAVFLSLIFQGYTILELRAISVVKRF